MPWKAKSIPSPHAGHRPPARRPSAAAQGYDAEWRRIRAEHLAQFPNCVSCGRPGSHVDHRIPLKQGGTHDHSNLQTLCAGCHSRKTASQDGGFGHKVQR